MYTVLEEVTVNRFGVDLNAWRSNYVGNTHVHLFTKPSIRSNVSMLYVVHVCATISYMPTLHSFIVIRHMHVYT
jgi:hypothetical protein